MTKHCFSLQNFLQKLHNHIGGVTIFLLAHKQNQLITDMQTIIMLDPVEH